MAASQQKVAVGDVIEIDKVATAAGRDLSLPAVLVVDGETVTTDADTLAKVDVTAEVLGATKGPKIHILKYKNKTGYQQAPGSPPAATPRSRSPASPADRAASKSE